MPTESLAFRTQSGHDLAGSLELPTGTARGVALFAHCFTCTKQSRAAISVARALAAEGFATLRFDFTGLGGSEGEFGRAGFATDVADLVAASGYLINRFDSDILLVGHSLGGAAVLAAARNIDRVAAIATIGAPSDVPHVLHNIKGDLASIKEKGAGQVTIGGRPFDLSREFLERTEEANLLDEVEKLRAPLLFLHSPTDQIVGIEHAGNLFQAAKHPKSFTSLHGADHLLTKDEDARFAATMIASWASRYIGPDAGEKPSDGVLVTTGHGKFGTQVQTVSHAFVADEPTSYGGEDSGPTPYDLLLAALGTCTAMTMKMYADRKKLPFEGTTIHVTHERNHQEDCEHVLMEENGMEIQALHRRIELHGDLDTEQRNKLIEIADKCPVHRTLEGHLHIHTEAET